MEIKKIKNITKEYSCPCCGYNTLHEEPPGTHSICPICFWEDDDIQFYDPDYTGGANRCSLREAQDNFAQFGACEERSIKHVRKPNESDIYEGPKDISAIRRVPIEEIIRIFKVLNIPMEKVLELYALNEVRGSSLVFNREELEKYISFNDIVAYSKLIKGKTQFIQFHAESSSINTIHLTEEEGKYKLQSVVDEFLEAVEKA